MKKQLKFETFWHSFGYFLVVLVVILSLGPLPEIPFEDFRWSDKFLHFLAYGFLMLWFTQLYTRNVYWVLAVIFCMIGMGLEMAQTLTDERFFELGDMAANGVGVGFGWVTANIGFNSILDKIEKLF